MILVIAGFTVCFGNTMQAKDTKQMKIKLIFDDATLTATLYDNATAKDFASLLPLTLKLEDYASKEKVSNLPRKLSLTNSPAGSDPSIGDITYYAPWGNLAIFYKDFGYANGLVILGNIDANVNYLKNWSKSKTVRIEMVK